jgi:PiT family inorganic phosphate transporter
MSALLNFLGVFVMTRINSSVASTISNIVSFGSDVRAAHIALCAAMLSIVIYSVGAARMGIPTSESHSLIAGLSGAAIAIHKGVGGINTAEWSKVIYGLVLSLLLGFCLGFILCRLVAIICAFVEHRRADGFFKRAQIFGAAAMSFMHGAQDGQKFIGVLFLGVAFSNGQSGVYGAEIPTWLMLLCSVVMAVGTSVGGEKIIKAVGVDMARLERYQGFSADIAAALCLFLSSAFGIPVSTTHTKTTAIMGAGAVRGFSAINFEIVRDIAYAWIFTFPVCGGISFIIARLFMVIFN